MKSQPIIEAIAEKFSDKIREVLTPEELEIVNEENATNNGEFCGTHNFVDANMYMLEAYQEVTGEEPELDLENAEPFDTFSVSWKLAIDAKFNYKAPQQNA